MAISAAAINWSDREESLRKEEWDLARRLIARASLILELPLVDATPVDAVRMFDLASKLSRLACGAATKRTELSGTVVGKVGAELGISRETMDEIVKARAEYEKERMPFSPEHIKSVYKDHLRREIEEEMAEQRRLNPPEPS